MLYCQFIVCCENKVNYQSPHPCLQLPVVSYILTAVFYPSISVTLENKGFIGIILISTFAGFSFEADSEDNLSTHERLSVNILKSIISV